jgi:16S rRNA processing protein RimM
MPARNSSPTPAPPPFLLLGRVMRPHGVRGEICIQILTAYPERIVADMRVYLGNDPKDPSSAVARRVESARKHQRYLLLQLEGITDRSAAELMRGEYVMVPLQDAIPLDAGEFYLFQVIGLAVYTEEGEHLGEVVDVIETGANDVYVVRGPHGEVLLPAIDECVLDVDIDGGKMTVHLLEGLLSD